MKQLGSKRGPVPVDAFLARPVAADPRMLDAHFAKVASYEASERKRDQRAARTGFVIGVIGCLIGVLGVGSTAALAPLKQVYPLVFRVDQASGAVERVYDVHGGGMDVGEAEKRYFLWQYVRYRQTYTAAEAAMNFNSVVLLSSSDVQQAYAALFKGHESELTTSAAWAGWYRDGAVDLNVVSRSHTCASEVCANGFEGGGRIAVATYGGDDPV